MRTGIALSAGLHVGIIAFAWFGLPQFRSEPLLLDDIVFVKMADLSDITNVPPDRPQPEPAETKPEPPTARTPPPEPTAKPAPKPEPAAAAEPPPEPKPAARPAPKPEPAAAAEPPPEPEPAAKPPPEPKPAPAPRPKPKPAAAAPKPASRPKPRPEPEPRPEPKPKPAEKRPVAPSPQKLAQLLKTLKKDPPAARQPAEETTQSRMEQVLEATRSQTASAFDADRQVTVDEIHALRQQIAQCWNIAAGARNAETLKVEVAITMNPNATIREARIVDRTRMQSDPHFRAAAESALRALADPRCSPLRLPAGKYSVWKTFTFNFDPSNMLQ